ncbi:hypothetical protein [Pseudoalteromonas rubra]|uniref:Uncharacterized protein n=1 Tax=Pseudoalteromonas rubra TaxID=43658 RepID=A0A0U3ID39_9GAMM|nr:hypothetical protein [Pseudoalteromonas rubra]ALU46031.1 hypothetical protein AT705_24260 [Pseudoalteromonas rubra]
MRNRGFNKFALGVPVVLALLIALILFFNKDERREECLLRLNSLYPVHAKVEEILNTAPTKDARFFAFKYVDNNANIYSLLLDKGSKFELHRYYQFGGWDIKHLPKIEGRALFSKFETLFAQSSDRLNSGTLHAGCGAAMFKSKNDKVEKMLASDSVLLTTIVGDIENDRQKFFNDRSHLNSMNYNDELERLSIERIKDSLFHETDL